MNLKEYIRTVPDYPVPGVNFYDVNSLFAGPVFTQVMDLLRNKTQYSFETPSHIVGIESRGFVIGSILAYAMDLPFIMVRKKGAKYPGELLEQSYALEYGEATLTLQTGLLGHTDRCVIVDDLIATGGTAEAASRLIEISKGKVGAFIFVINLFDLGGSDKLIEKGFKVENLIDFPGH